MFEPNEEQEVIMRKELQLKKLAPQLLRVVREAISYIEEMDMPFLAEHDDDMATGHGHDERLCWLCLGRKLIKELED